MKTLTFCLALIVMSCTPSFGQTYKVLYSFKGPKLGDAAYSDATLLRDSNGNLYGTSVAGGVNACQPYGSCGTVFELSPNSDGTWSEKVLYSFCSNRVNGQCYDGQMPLSGLVMDVAGNLYGTTSQGGSATCPLGKVGCGTVFQLSPPSFPGTAWTETVIRDFCQDNVSNSCLDGAVPGLQTLIADSLGNLYGTTEAGGASGSNGGTVFELSPGSNGSWTGSVLYSFCPEGGDTCPDGSGPNASVVFDTSGNLYGTTSFGGLPAGVGTVFKLTPGSGGWNESVLYSVPAPYKSPTGDVSFDSTGNLFTAINQGGPFGNNGGILKLTTSSSAHIFPFNGPNGSQPTLGVLADAQTNAVYGTASVGGSHSAGIIFRIGAQGKLTTVHTFCQRQNCTDGSNPIAGLTIDPSGNAYGTTQRGGKTTDGASYGVVYEISP